MGATGFSMPYLEDKETGKIKDNPTFEEVHGGEVQEQGDRGWDGDQGDGDVELGWAGTTELEWAGRLRSARWGPDQEGVRG